MQFGSSLGRQEINDEMSPVVMNEEIENEIIG